MDADDFAAYEHGGGSYSLLRFLDEDRQALGDRGATFDHYWGAIVREAEDGSVSYELYDSMVQLDRDWGAILHEVAGLDNPDE